MSIKTLLAHIWQEIKSFFKTVTPDLKEAVHIGVIVTENIKLFTDSPIADIFTALIPGDIDDQLKTVLRSALPRILTQLKLADNCGQLTEPQDITRCAIAILQGLDGDIKSAFLHNLSVLIAQAAADGKLSWSDGVIILEGYYQQNFKAVA